MKGSARLPAIIGCLAQHLRGNAQGPAGQFLLVAGRRRAEGQHSGRNGQDLLARGYITVTPLRFEYTDEAGIAALEKMGL